MEIGQVKEEVEEASSPGQASPLSNSADMSLLLSVSPHKGLSHNNFNNTESEAVIEAISVPKAKVDIEIESENDQDIKAHEPELPIYAAAEELSNETAVFDIYSQDDNGNHVVATPTPLVGANDMEVHSDTGTEADERTFSSLPASVEMTDETVFCDNEADTELNLETEQVCSLAHREHHVYNEASVNELEDPIKFGDAGNKMTNEFGFDSLDDNKIDKDAILTPPADVSGKAAHGDTATEAGEFAFSTLSDNVNETAFESEEGIKFESESEHDTSSTHRNLEQHVYKGASADELESSTTFDGVGNLMTNVSGFDSLGDDVIEMDATPTSPADFSDIEAHSDTETEADELVFSTLPDNAERTDETSFHNDDNGEINFEGERDTESILRAREDQTSFDCQDDNATSTPTHVNGMPSYSETTAATDKLEFSTLPGSVSADETAFENDETEIDLETVKDTSSAHNTREHEGYNEASVHDKITDEVSSDSLDDNEIEVDATATPRADDDDTETYQETAAGVENEWNEEEYEHKEVPILPILRDIERSTRNDDAFVSSTADDDYSENITRDDTESCIPSRSTDQSESDSLSEEEQEKGEVRIQQNNMNGRLSYNEPEHLTNEDTEEQYVCAEKFDNELVIQLEKLQMDHTVSSGGEASADVTSPSVRQRVTDRLRAHREKLQEQLRQSPRYEDTDEAVEAMLLELREVSLDYHGEYDNIHNGDGYNYDDISLSTSNSHSHNSESDSTPSLTSATTATSIAHRSQALLNQRDARIQHERQRQLRAEVEGLRDRPAINANSVRLASGPSGQRRRRLGPNTATTPSTTNINTNANAMQYRRTQTTSSTEHSTMLTRETNQSCSSSNANNVGESLYQRGIDQRLRMEEMREEVLDRLVPANPAITKQAAVLERPGPVGDRLYRAAVEHNARRQSLGRSTSKHQQVREPKQTKSPHSQHQHQPREQQRQRLDHNRAQNVMQGSMSPPPPPPPPPLSKRTHDMMPTTEYPSALSPPRQASPSNQTFNYNNDGIIDDQELARKRHLQYQLPPPSSVVSSTTASSSVVRGTMLYNKGLERLRSMEERTHRQDLLAQRRATPVITVKSRELAAVLGSSKERLLRPRASPASPQHDPELRSKPKINRRSKQLAKEVGLGGGGGGYHSTGMNGGVHQRLHFDHVRAQEKRQLVLDEHAREQQEMTECTFRPHIQRSRETAKWAAGRVDNGMNVQQRTALWAARRKARLEAQQHDNEANAISEECTFKPNVNTSEKRARMVRIRRASEFASSGGASASDTHRSSNSGVRVGNEKKPQKQTARDPSFNKFVERQQRARAEKQRMMDAMQGNTGARWTGETTVGHAPVLESERRIRQRNQRQQQIETVERERLRLAAVAMHHGRSPKGINSSCKRGSGVGLNEGNGSIGDVDGNENDDDENFGRTANEQGGSSGTRVGARVRVGRVGTSYQDGMEARRKKRSDLGIKQGRFVGDSATSNENVGDSDFEKTDNEVTVDFEDEDDDIFSHYPTLRSRLQN